MKRTLKVKSFDDDISASYKRRVLELHVADHPGCAIVILHFTEDTP